MDRYFTLCQPAMRRFNREQLMNVQEANFWLYAQISRAFRRFLIFMISALIAIHAQIFLAYEAVALPGDLVSQFGSNGRARAPMLGSNVVVRTAAQQRDGKLVVTASCTASTGFTSFCISRFNANGSHDTSATRTWHHSASGGIATPAAIAIDANDRILVAGGCSSATSGMDFCVVRFLPDLTIDNRFGNAGFVVLPIAAGTSNESATAIALLPNGSILVGGSCARVELNVLAMCIAQFQNDGKLVKSFGDAGIAEISFVDNPSNRTDLLNALTTDFQGTIYAAGSCQWPATNAQHFCVITINANGSRTAAHRLQASTINANSSYINAMSWTADGKLAVAGGCTGNVSTGIDFCLARFNPVALGGFEQLNESDLFGVYRAAIGYQALADDATSIAVQPDGRIVVGGSCGLNPATSADAFCWMRHMPTGEADRSLNENGDGVGAIITEFSTNPARHDRGSKILLTQAGDIILVGHCETATAGVFDMCAAKYQGGPVVHTYCSPDIDGDGRINPLIDGLIMTRIALGLRDDRVMGGIVPAADALRRGWDWSDGVAAYLARECGVTLLQYRRLIAADD
jgi:uncharacterized delta-60 repeat protein